MHGISRRTWRASTAALGTRWRAREASQDGNGRPSAEEGAGGRFGGFPPRWSRVGRDLRSLAARIAAAP